MRVHHFQVAVNCFLADTFGKTDALQDAERLYADDGLLILPDGYREDGERTRLVINCHGAGGTVTTDDSQAEHQVLTQYLVANGYAVMDVNGLPEAYAREAGIDIRNNVGSPIALQCYVKAYRYCMEHFHLKPEVFVHGASMGGISSTNLVLSGCIPVIAHSAFCPVLDAYNEMFLHPWSDGLPKEALGRIYGFEKGADGEYIYDAEKLAGFDPATNARARLYPVPVKFWHCEDDDVVSYEVTKRFVGTIREHGGIAYLRTFSHGGHQPQMVGAPIASPSGRHEVGGSELQITPAVEEAFLWIRRFDL